jgi:Contractile injection system tube protein
MTPLKAQITVLEGRFKGQAIKAMFNPDQITYTKRNKWDIHHTTGQVLPTVSFSSSDPATLRVVLMFDGTETGKTDDKKTVAHTIDELTSLTKVDKSLDNGTVVSKQGKASKSKQNRPPTVQFQWGNYLSFKAIIQSMTTTFSLFLDDGTPVRASVDVMFQQVEDENAFPHQNPTSGGRTGERVYRLGPRETLDQVAYDRFGDTALWRALADFNGIDDPLRVQAGDAILLPASADDLKALA